MECAGGCGGGALGSGLVGAGGTGSGAGWGDGDGGGLSGLNVSDVGCKTLIPPLRIEASGAGDWLGSPLDCVSAAGKESGAGLLSIMFNFQ